MRSISFSTELFHWLFIPASNYTTLPQDLQKTQRIRQCRVWFCTSSLCLDSRQHYAFFALTSVCFLSFVIRSIAKGEKLPWARAQRCLLIQFSLPRIVRGCLSGIWENVDTCYFMIQANVDILSISLHKIFIVFQVKIIHFNLFKIVINHHL